MRYVNAAGVLQRARRFMSAVANVRESDVKNEKRLAEILSALQRRVSELESRVPPEGTEFEVNTAAGGTTFSLYHGFNSAVRWYVVQWTRAGAVYPVAGHDLVKDASSTSTTLVIRSYRAGKVIIRVEPAFADITEEV